MVSVAKFLARNIATVLLVILVIVATTYVTGKLGGLRDFLFPDQIIAEHRFTIVTGVQALGQLVTVKHEVAKTDIKVEIHRGILNSGYYSAEHDVIGAIEAGINFDALDEDSVRFQNDAYIVTLPTPIVTSCRIEYIDQNEYSFTLLAADWDMVRQIAHVEALEKFAEEMIEAGILDRAAEEADIQVGDFVRHLTGNPADIRFAERRDEIELPESCKPIAPSGWEKADDGGWKRSE